MTTAQLKQMGEAHRAAGKDLTPHACQDIDRMLFDACRREEHPARCYARLRGAFNRGWEAEHWKQVA